MHKQIIIMGIRQSRETMDTRSARALDVLTCIYRNKYLEDPPKPFCE